MPLPRDRAFLLLLLLSVLLGLAYNAAILLGYGPDEPRHMAYVNLLFTEHTLPRINPDGTEYYGAHYAAPAALLPAADAILGRRRYPPT